MRKEIKLLESSKSFFSEIVSEAIDRRRLKSSPFVTQYLVDLLDMYIVAQNSQLNQTYAEQYLKAMNSEKSVRVEMLKKLGDTSLYVSGVFGDSLRRKIIDIDYYADIGGMAYRCLAHEVGDEDQAIVYKEISYRFLDYVDVLTYVGQFSGLQTNQDLLRLYERYIATGSPLAKEQLVEKGLLTNMDKKKVAQ